MTRVVEERKTSVYSVQFHLLRGSRLIGWEFQLRMDFGVIESALLLAYSFTPHQPNNKPKKEIKQRLFFFFIFSQLHLLKIVLHEKQAKKSYFSWAS